MRNDVRHTYLGLSTSWLSPSIPGSLPRHRLEDATASTPSRIDNSALRYLYHPHISIQLKYEDAISLLCTDSTIGVCWLLAITQVKKDRTVATLVCLLRLTLCEDPMRMLSLSARCPTWRGYLIFAHLSCILEEMPFITPLLFLVQPRYQDLWTKCHIGNTVNWKSTTFLFIVVVVCETAWQRRPK